MSAVCYLECFLRIFPSKLSKFSRSRGILTYHKLILIWACKKSNHTGRDNYVWTSHRRAKSHLLQKPKLISRKESVSRLGVCIFHCDINTVLFLPPGFFFSLSLPLSPSPFHFTTMLTFLSPTLLPHPLPTHLSISLSFSLFLYLSLSFSLLSLFFLSLSLFYLHLKNTSLPCQQITYL